jgi:hypothetical protein
MQAHSSSRQTAPAESPAPRRWLDFLPKMDAYPYPGRSAYYPWAASIDRRRSRPVRLAQAFGRGISQRLSGAIRARRRPDPWLSPYPCRLPNGEMGRTAAVVVDGEWTLVCRFAG